MSATERSVFDVFQDIASNIQDIVRSEVRLAKTQIREEISTSQSSALLLGIGVLSAIFALFFALLALVYALSFVLLTWAAALLVASGLALCAGIAERVNGFETPGVMRLASKWVGLRVVSTPFSVD